MVAAADGQRGHTRRRHWGREEGGDGWVAGTKQRVGKDKKVVAPRSRRRRRRLQGGGEGCVCWVVEKAAVSVREGEDSGARADKIDRVENKVEVDG